MRVQAPIAQLDRAFVFEIKFDFESKPIYTKCVYKKCTRCQQILDISEFNWKIKNVKLTAHCKKCSRQYVKNHYQKNIKYYIDKAKKRNFELKQKEQAYIGDFLQSHPCVDCGEANILVLEFDHKNKEDKYDDIAWMMKRRLSFQRVINEINKCEVRCANCHRIKTAKENNSWKLKYMRQ